MRMVIYIVILAALFFVPLQRVEIANLEPIEAVWIYEEGGSIFLETDTQDKGSGATVAEALEDMKHNSSGIVYLDTAQYLFVSSSATEAVAAVRPYLKASVRLCAWNGEGELQAAVRYADSHKIGITMKRWDEADSLPELPPVKWENSDKSTG